MTVSQAFIASDGTTLSGQCATVQQWYQAVYGGQLDLAQAEYVKDRNGGFTAGVPSAQSPCTSATVLSGSGNSSGVTSLFSSSPGVAGHSSIPLWGWLAIGVGAYVLLGRRR